MHDECLVVGFLITEQRGRQFYGNCAAWSIEVSSPPSTISVVEARNYLRQQRSGYVTVPYKTRWQRQAEIVDESMMIVGL